MGHDRNVWILVYPAPDVPGEWVSHCLDVDVVMQGASPRTALQAVLEGVVQVVSFDLQRNVDPFARSAPRECWEELLRITTQGEAPVRTELALDAAQRAAPGECPLLAVQARLSVDALHDAQPAAPPQIAWRLDVPRRARGDLHA